MEAYIGMSLFTTFLILMFTLFIFLTKRTCDKWVDMYHSYRKSALENYQSYNTAIISLRSQLRECRKLYVEVYSSRDRILRLDALSKCERKGMNLYRAHKREKRY